VDSKRLKANNGAPINFVERNKLKFSKQVSNTNFGITGAIKNLMTTASKKFGGLVGFGSCLKPQIKGKENTERVKDFGNSVVKSTAKKEGLNKSFQDLTISN
jgi:hypothetical protein